MDKPEILYHGSRHKNIDELEPKLKSYRDLEEGELVFATQSLPLATIFMASGSCHITAGIFNQAPYVVFAQSRDEFLKDDNGGHVYILSSKTFETNPSKGMGVYEWTSKEKVKPLGKIEFSSSLDAMLENGVQVYFADENTLKNIRESGDHGYSVLKSMESENQKRGINVKEF